MSERRRRLEGSSPVGSEKNAREERLRTLYRAAYQPVQPSEALQRRVAAAMTQHDTRGDRQSGRRPLPFGWGPAVRAVAAASLLLVLGLLFARWDHSRAR